MRELQRKRAWLPPRYKSVLDLAIACGVRFSYAPFLCLSTSNLLFLEQYSHLFANNVTFGIWSLADLIVWLSSKGLLAHCTSCNIPMRQDTRRVVTDGLISSKTTKISGKEVFTSLPLKKQRLLKEYPVSDVQVDKKHHMWCLLKEECSTKLLQINILLGGSRWVSIWYNMYKDFMQW